MNQRRPAGRVLGEKVSLKATCTRRGRRGRRTTEGYHSALFLHCLYQPSNALLCILTPYPSLSTHSFMNNVTIDKRYFVFDTNKMSLNYYKDEKSSLKESSRGYFDLGKTVIITHTSPSAEPKLLELVNPKYSMDLTFNPGHCESDKLVMGAIKNDKDSERLMDIIQKRVEKNSNKSTVLVKPDNEERINEMFAEVLEALAIPEAKHHDMMEQSSDIKWKLIERHSSLIQEDDVSDASVWADLLKAEKGFVSLIDARQIKTVIKTSPKNWLINFLSDGGFVALIDMIGRLGKLPDISGYEASVLSELLGCLKGLMNNQLGLDGVLGIEAALNKIASCLQLCIEEIYLQVLELLSVCCFASEEQGLTGTLGAMEAYRVENREPARFISMVECLENSTSGDLMLSILTFINTMIAAAPELETRVFLRDDFLRLNFLVKW
jgi:hypothetical protein